MSRPLNRRLPPFCFLSSPKLSSTGRFLIVLNMAEAEYVANYILNGGDRVEFFAKFKNAMSDNFDPDTDLDAIGVANQTTMLKTETEEIGKMFEKTMMKKFGPQNLNKHFVSFNTICDATQERQDAMVELLAEPLDLVLVVGGFNSSNTSHLQEMSESVGVTSYWVNDPSCIGWEKLPSSKLHASSPFLRKRKHLY